METNKIYKIGIIGGGQLAMFLAKSCKTFNQQVIILESFKDCSAAKYADQFILGIQNNFNDLKKLFEVANYVIFENENLDVEILSKLEIIYPNKLIQSSIVMQIFQHRLHEKIFLNNLGITTAKYFLVKNFHEIIMAKEIFQKDMLLKTTRFGYDGKNQLYLKYLTLSEQENLVNTLLKSNECIVEKICDFKYEISFIGTYHNQKITNYLPITKNIHKNGILFKSEIIKNYMLTKAAKNIFTKIISVLPGSGILAIEFFVDKNNKLIVNEIAPRVHNSGHHSLDNCQYSQFDLMIANILGIKLNNKVINNLAMYNILGQSYQIFKNNKLTGNKPYYFYDYFKTEVKHNRKMAHINTSINLDYKIDTD